MQKGSNPGRPTRPARVPTLAAGLLAVGALLASCTGSGHGDAPPTSTSTSTSTTVAPTNSATPPGSASPYTWQRSTAPALDLGGGASTTLSAVVPPQDSNDWTIFGTVVDSAGIPTATEWTSPNGVTWIHTPLSADGGASQVLAAASYRGRTVVVGSSGQGAAQRAEAWVSAQPGDAFQPEQMPPAAGPSSMTAVAAGALGVFAIGEVNGEFALWSSANGTDWSEEPAAERAIESAPDTQVHAILAFQSSVYLAGSIQPGDSQEGALWSTSNGINWQSVNDSQTSFADSGDHAIYSLAEIGTGMVAVGAVDRGEGWQPASWISPDGISWSPESTDFPGAPTAGATGERDSPGSGTALTAVTSITTTVGPTSVVATGGGPYGQGVWDSDDGLHWKPMSLPTAASSATSWTPGAVGATPTSAVVVDTSPGRPYVLTNVDSKWTQPSAHPAVFGSVHPYVVAASLDEFDGKLMLEADVVNPPQSIGPAPTSATELSSTDGLDWSKESSVSGAPRPPESGAVTVRVGTGWMAIGPALDGIPQIWTWSSKGTWTAAGALESAAAAALSPEATVLGACAASVSSASSSAPTSTSTSTLLSGSTTGVTSSATLSEIVAAVGSVLLPASSSQSSATPIAAAWSSSHPPSSWKRATVQPSPAAGSAELMAGCTSVQTSSAMTASSGPAHEFVAYGAASSTSGSPEPGLWRSTSGSVWTRFADSAFGAGSPNPNVALPQPLVSLVTSKDVWLAIAAPENPAGTVGVATAGPTPDVEDGADGLWMSTDSGTTWQLLDTSASPWTSNEQTQLGSAAFLGTTAVVAGSADGELAVWVGTATSAGGSTSPTTLGS